MKKTTFLLGAAAALLMTAPVSAKAQSCAWWNLACNGLAPVVEDNGWHIAGRDANGNVLYMRRRVDSNGNLVFEQARRTYYGNYFVTNNHILTRDNVYNANGERCRYESSNRGYKEECKYAKGTYVSGIRTPSSRFGSYGSNCKFESSDKGYKEECKYDKAYNAAYKAAKVKPVKYEAPKVKVHTVKPKAIKYDHDIKGAKPHKVDYHAVKYEPAKIHGAKAHEVKGHEVKVKGPKH
jgi:hypothetical protein